MFSVLCVWGLKIMGCLSATEPGQKTEISNPVAGDATAIYQLIGKMSASERRAYNLVLGCLLCDKLSQCQTGSVIVEQPRSLLEFVQDEPSPALERVALPREIHP